MGHLVASVLTHSLSSLRYTVESLFGATVLGEDVFCGGGPDEWLWVLISMFDPVCDRLFGFINGVEGSSPDALARDFGK